MIFEFYLEGREVVNYGESLGKAFLAEQIASAKTKCASGLMVRGEAHVDGVMCWGRQRTWGERHLVHHGERPWGHAGHHRDSSFTLRKMGSNCSVLSREMACSD